MPDRFPALAGWAAFLLLAALLLTAVIPPAAELGRVAFVKEVLSHQ